MSGPCVHYLIARELPHRFEARSQDHLNGKAFADILKSHPVHASIGAQGPDFLFFLLADVLGTAGSQVDAHTPANDLGARLARATLNSSAQIEELNAHLFATHSELEQLIEAKKKFDQAVDEQIERSQSLSALRDGANALQSLLQLIMSTVVTGVKATLTDTFDIFSLLDNPVQAADPLQTWWWFDVLHYRRSGEYASALINHALRTEDEAFLAYAIGYSSHYAADTIGHPYVNTIVRGPYRHHGQRHKVVENIQDVWAWREFFDQRPRQNAHIDVMSYLKDRFGSLGGQQQLDRLNDGEFVTSQLHLEYQFDPKFISPGHGPSREELELFPTLDPSVALPDTIAQGIHDVMTQVYSSATTPDGKYPRVPDPLEIQAAYRLWYAWFRGSTSNGILPQAVGGHIPPTEDIITTVREIVAQAVDKAEQAADILSEAGQEAAPHIKRLFDDLRDLDLDGSFDPDALVDMIKEIADKVLEGLSEVAVLIDDLMGPLVEKSVSVIKALIQIIYQKLYGVYLHFRKLLAASGLGFPAASMIDEQRFAHMTDPDAHADATGRRLADKDVRDNYPMMPLARAELEQPLLGETHEISFMKSESHLIYPPILKGARVESPDLSAGELPAFPGPRAYRSEQADYYMWTTSAPDPTALNAFFALGDRLRGAETADVSMMQDYADLTKTLENTELGNAVDLTVALVQHVVDGRILPNVNLDGDRGMSFPTWIMSAKWRAQSEENRPFDALGTVNITPDPNPV